MVASSRVVAAIGVNAVNVLAGFESVWGLTEVDQADYSRPGSNPAM
jgi:hypothetical protein